MSDARCSEDDLRARLGRLDLEQKVRLLTGASFWALQPEPDAGLRRLVVSDGPAGVRGELWDERDTSANVPSPTALAATWDEDLLAEIGRLSAAEARRKGVDVVLAPTVNLHRSPYGGRHFECFSEDPVLTGRIGAAFVGGLQGEGVGATVKHFVGNDSETDRYTADMQIDERTLHEVYLAPFEAIVRDAGAWSVMAAYNSVNGHLMTESPLLRSVLHDDWGFDGVTMTDWYAGRSTDSAALSGLDLVMPGPTGPWGDDLVAAVGEGRVPEALVNDKVLRILRLASRVGCLDAPARPYAPRSVPDPATSALLRRTAAAGFVLLRNEALDGVPVLPVDRAEVRRVAVVGPNAHPGRALGGGSAFVFPDRTVSPLEGITAAFGPDVEVTYAEGIRAHQRTAVGDPAHLTVPDRSGPGVELVFLEGSGRVLGTDVRVGTAFNWNNDFGDVDTDELASIELHTRLTAPSAGTYRLGASGLGRYLLRLDGRVAFDERLELPAGADPVEGLMRPPQQCVDVQLEAGQELDLVLTHVVKDRVPGEDLLISFQVNIDLPYAGDEEALDDAVRAAAEADVVFVVVGTNEEVESEGFDRDSLGLPGRQGDLVRRVAAANPRTVAVVNAGAPVTLPWRDVVPALVLSWFPGQEFGHALADVMVGATEPGGRLPTTWPVDESTSLPSTWPVEGVVSYDEGLHVGYRRFLHDGVQPAYWFGHGLGYTTWECAGLTAARDGDAARAAVTLQNTGDRAGRQLVQVYLSRRGSVVDRPVRWLAAYAWAQAGPGEDVTATVAIPRRAFAYWDVRRGGWVVEPGVFDVEVGWSAGEITERVALEVW